MKKPLTEQEVNLNNHHQVYRLSVLSKKDPGLFEDICSILPFSIYINRRDSLNMTLANANLQSWLETPESDLIHRGFEYIRNISDLNILEMAVSVVKKYEASGDMDRLCSYFQRMKVYGRLQWVLTYKKILDDSSYFNIGHTLTDLGKVGNHLEDILGETLIRNDGWARFCSLTKREKQILRMMAEGYTNEEIGGVLFTSKFTVKTHRRNLMNKIGASNIREVMRFVQAFELTGQI